MDSIKYEKICGQVELGFPVGKACKRVGVCSSEYYREATREQKDKIALIKALSYEYKGRNTSLIDTKNLEDGKFL